MQNQRALKFNMIGTGDKASWASACTDTRTV